MKFNIFIKGARKKHEKIKSLTILSMDNMYLNKKGLGYGMK